MYKSSFLKQLILLIITLIIGFPVTLTVLGLLLLGFAFLFILTVGAFILTTAPIIFLADEKIAYLISGVPPSAITYFGAAVLNFIICLIVIYIFFSKAIIKAVIKFFKNILTGGANYE